MIAFFSLNMFSTILNDKCMLQKISHFTEMGYCELFERTITSLIIKKNVNKGLLFSKVGLPKYLPLCNYCDVKFTTPLPVRSYISDKTRSLRKCLTA